MNWDAIGAVDTILGAMAVLPALVYLAIQVRQSAQATLWLRASQVSMSTCRCTQR